MSPIGRMLMSVLFTAASLPASSASWPRLEFPDSMQLQIVSEEMRVNGVPMKVIEFRSSQSQQEIKQWFSDAWAGQIAHGQGGGWQVLSHREKDVLITVQMTALGIDGSRGFIAVSQMFVAIGKKAVASDLPMLPGTELVNHIEAEDHGKKSRTTVLISDRSSRQNLDFYLQHFRLQGYRPISPGALSRSGSGGAMILNRGSEALDLAAVERDGRAVITIVSLR